MAMPERGAEHGHEVARAGGVLAAAQARAGGPPGFPREPLQHTRGPQGPQDLGYAARRTFVGVFCPFERCADDDCLVCWSCEDGPRRLRALEKKIARLEKQATAKPKTLGLLRAKINDLKKDVPGVGSFFGFGFGVVLFLFSHFLIFFYFPSLAIAQRHS